MGQSRPIQTTGLRPWIAEANAPDSLPVQYWHGGKDNLGTMRELLLEHSSDKAGAKSHHVANIEIAVAILVK